MVIAPIIAMEMPNICKITIREVRQVFRKIRITKTRIKIRIWKKYSRIIVKARNKSNIHNSRGEVIIKIKCRGSRRTPTAKHTPQNISRI